MRKGMLGRTGYEVAALGLGAWGMGGDMWRDVDPRDAQRTLYRAVDAGVTFVDTALSYGDGTSEKLVGQVIRDLRARDWVVVATKVPPLDRRWPPAERTDLPAVFPPGYVVESVEQSLRNTGAEALGLAQLHVWHDRWLGSSAWPDVRGTMQRLVKEGKVLCWGISVNAHDPDSALAVLDEPLIATVQVIYNIYDQSAAAGLFGKARANHIGVIARCPFDEGALSGRLTRETRFAPDDFRARYFQGERLIQAVERAEALSALCGDEVASLAELALRFCLSHPDVDVVIPGMRRPEHLEANLTAAQRGALSPAMLDRLREQTWDKNWYLPPSPAVHPEKSR